MRDDFLPKVKDILANRAGHKCSLCSKATSGPGTDPGGAFSDGVAAHITAASAGGPRFDPTLSREKRRSAENGIWVCTQHGREIDADHSGYSVATLRSLKTRREEAAAKECSKAGTVQDQSACVLELPFVDNPYQLFDIIQTQPYTSSTTTALREQLWRTRRRANLLKLASQVMVETWRSHPEVAGILSTWLGNNSDQWQPTPAMKDKMELLCESEISADDWTRVASTNPLAFVLAVKGRPEIYQKALERTLCNRHWRDADAEHALRYYETRGAEVSAIIRHWEEGLRHDLLRAYDAPRIIDLLLAANMALKGRSTQHQLLELLTNQAKALAEGGQMNLARYVAEEVDVLRSANKE